MKIYNTLFIILLFCISSFAQKSTFVVQINGTEYLLSEGEELKLDTTSNQTVVSVKLADYKQFDNGTISFNHPSNMSYELETDIGYQNWTLSGNDFVIMLFQIDAVAKLDDFVNEMVNQFGRVNCTVEKTQIKLGDQNLVGKRINVTLVGQKLTMDLVELEGADSTFNILAFQDSLNGDGTASAESINSLEMLDRTIKYK